TNFSRDWSSDVCSSDLISLLKTKLNITAEAYKNTTKDLLILFPVAGTGYENQYRNLGDTENKGLEFSVNYNALNKKNFDLTFNRSEERRVGIECNFRLS